MRNRDERKRKREKCTHQRKRDSVLFCYNNYCCFYWQISYESTFFLYIQDFRKNWRLLTQSAVELPLFWCNSWLPNIRRFGRHAMPWVQKDPVTPVKRVFFKGISSWQPIFVCFFVFHLGEKLFML